MQDSQIPDSNEVLATLGQDATNRNFSRPARIATLLVGAVILAALGWLWLAPAETPISYKSERATRQDLTVDITATGQLAPVNEVDVGSELSGTVANVNVDFNDTVTAGQTLASLDTQELDAQVVQQQAALAVARAKVAQVNATLKEAELKQARTRDMVTQKLASQQDLDVSDASLARARADLQGAKAQVQQAQAALDAIKTRLAKSVIKAPINGIVLSRNVEPGQTVAASFNTPVLFSLAEDLSHMELHVDVDEADVGHLKEGQSAHFSVDAWPGRVFPARVNQVRFAPRTVDGVVTYETLLSVNNDDLSLRPGMTATAEINVATIENALLIPNAALRFTPPSSQIETNSSSNLFTRLMPRRPHRENRASKIQQGEAVVWILSEGHPKRVTIETGMSDGQNTEVKAGDVKAGDAIITAATTH